MEMPIPNPADTSPGGLSLVRLLRELRDETTTLVRQEIALAKAETGEKASHLIRQFSYVCAGVVVIFAALIVLILGIRDLLAHALAAAGLNPAVAALVSSFLVAFIIGIVGWSLIAKGKKALSEERLALQKSLQSLREDQNFVKEKLART